MKYGFSPYTYIAFPEVSENELVSHSLPHLFVSFDVFIVSLLPAVPDEVLDDGLRRVDDARVVAELEHPQHRREDGVAQKARQALQREGKGRQCWGVGRAGSDLVGVVRDL